VTANLSLPSPFISWSPAQKQSREWSWRTMVTSLRMTARKQIDWRMKGDYEENHMHQAVVVKSLKPPQTKTLLSLVTLVKNCTH